MEKKIRVGLFYNLQSDRFKRRQLPKDYWKEFDDPATITSIILALEANGYIVQNLKNPSLLLQDTQATDIVFSICEMVGFRFRESLVASLCETLELPYVFSPPDTLTMALDKNVTNLLSSQQNIYTPKWFYVQSLNELDQTKWENWPYIVKLSAEGSGMGFDKNVSIVHSFDELYNQVGYCLSHYFQPVIVQEYVSGRDFAISVYENKGKIIPCMPLECGIGNKKPLQLSSFLVNSMKDSAVKIFKTLGCRDAGRVDFKISNDLVPFFLEINPLPYLGEHNSYFVQSAKLSGINFTELIGKIVQNALLRYDIL